MTSAATNVANALRWEWFRLRRRVGFWVIIGLVGLAISGALTVSVAVQRLAPEGFGIPPHGFSLFVFEALAWGGPFLSVILASLVFGGDFGWGTWRSLFARGQPRWQSALAKLLLASVILTAIWIVAWLLSALLGLTAGDSAASMDTMFEIPDGWSAAAVRFFSALPVAIAYLGLGAVLCAAGRSTAFGVGVGVAVIIAESVAYPIAGFIVQSVSDASLSEYTRWTLHGVTNGFMGKDDSESWGALPFAPALLAYLVGLWALTLAILTRRDVRD